MTLTLNSNGRVRKNLAEQLDRLDRILDGLAGALNEAVASAVQQAVRGVLTELLNDPMLRAALTAAAAPAVETAAPVIDNPKRCRGEWLRGCWRGLIGGLQALTQVAGGCALRLQAVGNNVWQVVIHWLGRAWQAIAMLRHCRGPVLVALVAGAFTGLAAYVAGPWLAAAAGSVGGFTTTLAIQMGLWLRQLLRGAVGSCAGAEPTGL